MNRWYSSEERGLRDIKVRADPKQAMKEQRALADRWLHPGRVIKSVHA